MFPSSPPLIQQRICRREIYRVGVQAARKMLRCMLSKARAPYLIVFMDRLQNIYHTTLQWSI
jgi:hypothetical protein